MSTDKGMNKDKNAKDNDDKDMQYLSNNKISPATRKSYKSGICQFLKYLFINKPELLTDAFREAVKATGKPLGPGLLASRLPGFLKGNDIPWPDPLQWSSVTAEDVMKWMVSKQKEGKMSCSQMGVNRSAIRTLFYDYGEAGQFAKISIAIGPLVTGLGRRIRSGTANDGIPINQGEALSFNTYRIIAMAHLKHSVAENGHCDGPFGHLYFLSMWNLMASANHVRKILMQHLSWKDDALRIHFGKSKNGQRGLKATYPRHLYANPLYPEICPILSLGIFLCSYNATQEKLFYGNSQKERYTKCLKRVGKACHAELIRAGVGSNALAIISCRKGAAAYCSSSIAGPSGTAVNIRAGWSIPGAEGTNNQYEAAGDQHVGRTCSGLPPDESFMMIHPFFLRKKENEVENRDNNEDENTNKLIFEAIRDSMGVDVTDAKNTNLALVCENALASVIHHTDFLSKTLPMNHRLFSTPLFLNRSRLQLLKSMILLRSRIQ